MKKDIELPKVECLELAVIYEFNDVFQTNDWNVYLINNQPIDLEMVIIVSKGFSGKKSSSLMRKRIDKLPANSFAKVELIIEELFDVNNQFQVSYFAESKVYEATYLLKENTIKEENLTHILELNKQGIFAEQLPQTIK